MRSVLACIFVLAAGSLLAAQTDVSSDQGKLIALENAWNQAQIHRDTRALDSLVGARFVYTDTDGTVMDKQRFMADIKDVAFTASSVANSDIHVYMYPNVALSRAGITR